MGFHLASGRASEGAGPVHQPLSVTVEQGPGTGDHPVPVPFEGLLRSNQLSPARRPTASPASITPSQYSAARRVSS